MKNPLQPSYRERESTPDNQLESEYKSDLKKVGLLTTDYTKEELIQNFAAYRREKLSAQLPLFNADDGRVGKMKNGKLDHVVTADGRTRAPTAAEMEQVAAEMAKVEAAVARWKPEDAHPFPVAPPGPAPQLESAERFAEWLADPKDRKKSLKRIADEDAELQVLAAGGRTALIAWRKAHLWVWLVTLLLAHYVVPVMRAVKKLFKPVSTLIVWLTTWP